MIEGSGLPSERLSQYFKSCAMRQTSSSATDQGMQLPTTTSSGAQDGRDPAPKLLSTHLHPPFHLHNFAVLSLQPVQPTPLQPPPLHWPPRWQPWHATTTGPAQAPLLDREPSRSVAGPLPARRTRHRAPTSPAEGPRGLDKPASGGAEIKTQLLA